MARLRNYFALAIVLFIPAWCSAIDLSGLPLADRLPGDTLLYVGWAGSESLGPQYQSSHLKAVIDSSSLPELFNALIPQILAKVPPGEKDAREALRLVSAVGGPMWRHPSAFYFGGINWDTGGPPLPRVAILCDAGNEADGLVTALQGIIAQARASGGGGPPIVAKKYGTLVVVSVMPVDTLDKAFAAAPTDSLSNSPNFKSALQQVQSDGVMALYIDVQGWVKMADDAVQHVGDPQGMVLWPKIRDGLGLGGFNQIIATSGFDGQDWSTQAFVSSNGSFGGVAALFEPKPLSDDALTVVPQTANRFAAGHFDFAALFHEIHTAIEQFDPNVGQQFNQGLSMVNALVGLDIEKDFLGSLGDQWGAYTDKTIGGPGLLGFVIVNKLKDPQREEVALTELSQRANFFIANAINDKSVTVEFRKTTVSGLTVNYLAVPFVAPGWAVKDGNLYLGLYPQVLAAAAQHVTDKAPSILQSPEYIALQKRLGDHKASSATYLNLLETAGDGYSDVLAMSRLYLGMADVFGIHTPPMTVPPLNKILPHLSPSGGVGWSDDAGWHYKSIEPFPGSGALAGSGSGATMIGPAALMTSILLPSLNRARETANRVKCASNERQIGQAMLMYANENKQKYPPDLGTLLKTGDITAQIFVCPSSNNEVPANLTPDQAADWVNVHSDYVYLGKGFSTASPADQIMLYEKPGAHGGDGMEMLYGDGHVDWSRTADAMRDIEAQQKKNLGAEGGGL